MTTTPTLAAASASIVMGATDEDALTAIKTYQFGQSREPLSVVQDLVAAAAKDDAQQRALAEKLAALLGSDATLHAKQFVCRQLAIIGTEENVPAIAALLGSAETADMARYALEPIPGAAADEALLSALAQGPAEGRIGAVNSLGARRVEAAMHALDELAGGADAALSQAAIAALGRIASKDAVAALERIQSSGRPESRRPAADALLAAATALTRDGQAAEARHIYRALKGQDQEAPVLAAAEIGLHDLRQG